MFSLTHRVIKTRDGKVYSGEPIDFEDHGSIVIYKGTFGIFKHHIHTENIVEDYESPAAFMFILVFCLMLVAGAVISLLASNSSSELNLSGVLQVIETPKVSGSV